MAHFALVEDNVVEDERRARQIAVLCQEGRDRPRRPVEPRQREVRNKGARFGVDADAPKQLIDLAVQGRQRRRRFDPGPDGVWPSFALEHAHPGDARRDRGRVERAERSGDVFAAVAVDLADEAQGQVQLVIVLPARRRYAVHRGAQQVADGARRAQRDEQAVGRHGPGSIIARAAAATETWAISGFA